MWAESAETLVAAINGAGLLDAEQRRELAALAGPFREARELADELVRRGWLTGFQAERLLEGRAASLRLGDYLLLAPLGEGGMGQVFKAHHALMNRLVAVKIVHQRLQGRPELSGRFRREIQLAARLNHPNLVTAYDAAEVGAQLLLVMEYCDGPNLADLVRQVGPLPVSQACDFIRQVALGLQYAFERGIVHRDIKPENLVVCGQVVKVLDMGLARLKAAEPAAERDGALTGSHVVLGTPDYLAPEQARESRDADIRSDLYSLGCTFYFALTGQVPFPGGRPVEKLLRHQLDAPIALETLRPEVAAEVQAVVQKLMSKSPAERYQTPAELAEALAPLARPTSDSAAGSIPRSCAGSAAVVLFLPASSSATPLRDGALTLRRQRWFRRPYLLGAALTTAGLLAVAAWWAAGRLSPQAIGPAGPQTPAVLPARLSGTLTTGGGEVRGVAISPDNELLAVACRNQAGAVMLFNVESRKLVKNLPGGDASALCVAFSPDGATLAYATGDNESAVPGDVTLWDLASRRPRHRFRAHDNGVLALAYAPDGRVFATAGREGMIRIWEAHTGKLQGSLEGHAGVVPCLAFSHNGRQLASASSDRTVRLWDLVRREEAHRFSTKDAGVVAAVEFSGDDDRLLAASGPTAGRGAEIRVWDLDTLDLARVISHGDSPILCMALAPDGKSLATGCRNGLLLLWDLDEGKPVHSYPGNNGPLRALCFSADGEILVTGYGDGQVKTWQPAR